jgi:hypothetical protein
VLSGIAARDKHTEHLLQEAQKGGSNEEDSCGWVWLELDLALLKQIHELKIPNIPNISTSYNTKAIVDDFKLYLNDVGHYQRISASFCGIEAATRVWKKYGVNSTARSMLD